MPPERAGSLGLREPSKMTTLTVNTSNDEPELGSRRLQRWSCTFCRNDKEMCDPQSRKWPEKCVRCEEKSLPCSAPARKVKRRRINDETVDPEDQNGDGEVIFSSGSSIDCPSSTESNESPEAARQPWDFKDLSNALGMLQLAAAEYTEHEVAYRSAIMQLPVHYQQMHASIKERLDELAELLKVFPVILEREIMSRLKTKPDSSARELLESAMNTLADPLSGIMVTLPLLPAWCPGPVRLQSSNISNSLRQRSATMLADGQVSLGIIYYHKGITHGQVQGDSYLSQRLKACDIPKVMAATAKEFGLEGNFASPSFWAWPSIIHPNTVQVSALETMNALLIKHWIGFKDCLELLGHPMLRGNPANDWKRVFRSMCGNMRGSRVSRNGRTNLHLAVLLGLVDESMMRARSFKLEVDKHDNDQRNALHLAAIMGNESILDTLVAVGTGASIVLRDTEGRTPVWYAAEGKKQRIFKKLLTATLKHRSMKEICSERDVDGNSLAEYGIAHGLTASELLDLVPWSDFPNVDHLRPTPWRGVEQDWQTQLKVPLGNALSPWHAPKLG